MRQSVQYLATATFVHEMGIFKMDVDREDEEVERVKCVKE